MLPRTEEMTLDDVYAQLMSGPLTKIDWNAIDWRRLEDHLSIPGQVHEIPAELYHCFLEASPPRLIGFHRFRTGTGFDPLRLFWCVGPNHFCRQLTWPETRLVCRVAALPYDEHGI